MEKTHLINTKKEQENTVQPIILASASPRRKEILEGLGIRFRIVSPNADEQCALTDPSAFVQELARRKGQAVCSALSKEERQTAVIVSADTVVVCGEEILGKPKDWEDACRMIRMLSGKEHLVVSGIGVTVGGITQTAAEVTRVRVGEIPEDQVIAYVDSGDPMDKAGGYGIQGRFSKWVEGIDGCYFNVVGLPVHRLNLLYHACTGAYLGR